MTFPANLVTNSAEQTEALGATLAEAIAADSSLPRFIALYGDLGVGKTAFVRGFTSAVCEGAKVKSPTYTVVNEYRGGRVPVFHFDMYRIDGWDDLCTTGYFEYLDGNFADTSLNASASDDGL